MIFHSINSLDALHPCYFSFCCTAIGSSTRVCKQIWMENWVQNPEGDINRKVENLLVGPAKKASTLQWLARLDAPNLFNRGGGGLLPLAGRLVSLLLRERSLTQRCRTFSLFAWPFPAPPQGWPNSSGRFVLETNATTTTGDANDNKDGEESDNESAGSNVIYLHTDEEAQFREPSVFDPIVWDETS